MKVVIAQHVGEILGLDELDAVQGVRRQLFDERVWVEGLTVCPTLFRYLC
jgi:hypothetical protein